MSKLLPEQAHKFADFLYKQRGSEGRANLAHLRHAAANPENDFRDLAILNPVLAADGRVLDAQRLVAGLFALYAARFWDAHGRLRLPRFNVEAKRHTLGASLRRLRFQLSGGQESLDLRFNALLNTAGEDLAVPLRGLLQRLATAEPPIPVDVARLLLDIVRWEYDHPDYPSVRRIWAREYWQFEAETNTKREAEQSATTDSEIS